MHDVRVGIGARSVPSTTAGANEVKRGTALEVLYDRVTSCNNRLYSICEQMREYNEGLFGPRAPSGKAESDGLPQHGGRLGALVMAVDALEQMIPHLLEELDTIRRV